MSQFRHPVEGFGQGMLECANCHTLMALEDYEPLQDGVCPTCSELNFIPQNYSGFWLFNPIALGGMGAVYRAYHEDYGDMEFAVKKLPPGGQDDPVLWRNLEDEIDTLNRIGEHPCLVKLIASGVANGEPYLVMNFVKGAGLDHLIEEHGEVPTAEMLLVAMRLLAAEGHILRNGFLYRDLKPENVLIAEEGAYLCDFGICMTVQDAMDDTGDMLQGSPFYMPPERILGDGEDSHSEIYSLGMVMYHGLTGMPFYISNDMHQLVQMHVEPPDGHREERLRLLDPDVADVVGKMIHRDPEARYQSFLELERDVFKVFSRLMRASDF